MLDSEGWEPTQNITGAISRQYGSGAMNQLAQILQCSHPGASHQLVSCSAARPGAGAFQGMTVILGLSAGTEVGNNTS